MPPLVASSTVTRLRTAERQARNEAWARIPLSLCSSVAMPFTLRMFTDLQASGNAFLCGRAPLWGDVFAFLWRIHPAYYRPYSARRYLDFPACSRLRRHCQHLAAQPGTPLAEACAEIEAYLARAFSDSPAGEPATDDSPLRTVPHFVDSVVDWCATRYGWEPATILDLPIACLFQLRRAAAISAGETVIDPSHTEIQKTWNR